MSERKEDYEEQKYNVNGYLNLVDDMTSRRRNIPDPPRSQLVGHDLVRDSADHELWMCKK